MHQLIERNFVVFSVVIAVIGLEVDYRLMPRSMEWETMFLSLFNALASTGKYIFIILLSASQSTEIL